MSDDALAPAAIEARLRALGTDSDVRQWPGVVEIAALFGKHRSTVWRWVDRDPPLIAHTKSPSGSGVKFDPVDVLRFLEESRTVHAPPDVDTTP